jgi:2-dehydropantoate 2-reductase
LQAGVQDVIILGLKEHQIEAAIDDIHSMVGPNTFFVTTQNGIPWWFFQRYSGPPQYNGSIIKAVDPNGRLFHGFDPERIVGMSSSGSPPPLFAGERWGDGQL